MTARAAIAQRLPAVVSLPRIEAAAALGMSVNHFDKLVTGGQMPRPYMAGSLKLWALDELLLSLKSLPKDGETKGGSWDDFEAGGQ